ncbi:hypothetical protein BGZ51_008276 [Haplosporangium sp. Z 767]|nr:hypothetical protein BGZ51_008276 [Haplosporangium sp. Z 767]
MEFLTRSTNAGQGAMVAFRAELVKLNKSKLNGLPILDYPKWARRLVDTERRRRKELARANARAHGGNQLEKLISASTRCGVTLYTDATPAQGAWISSKIFAVPSDLQKSSVEAEYYSAYQGIVDNAVPNNSIQLHCDNQEVCNVLQKGKTKNPKLKKLNQDLQSLLRANNISLAVSWVSSKENVADKLSRSKLE